ncbi:type II toxin-antitoxin system death-on-curing family toxin [Paractinoplanes durhamensis]|uniref:Toxin Doc n=1 Tax=Paractinoplanes durhamensis TaxID=113563 RepID=A0ABQ3Z5Y4_9ACTN|nr:Fic family protein [Actinoplanes durhamensis]GIE05238.1 toxin Doc [Actinoplanes durhamensis]
MIYLDEADLYAIAEQVLGAPPTVRDWGLLSASAARPRTLAFGFEPYPTVAEKAASLLVSLALNHALLDGNKRLALTAGLTFCAINLGHVPQMTNDAAYDMVIAVCEHRIDVPEVADLLRKAGATDPE